MASINALRSYLNGLPTDYQLHWYKIEQIIGQGAFGITYLAEDVNLDRKVAIKEYMPAQLAIRAEDQSAQPVSKQEAEKYFWGRDRFLNEARLLADVEHPRGKLQRNLVKNNFHRNDSGSWRLLQKPGNTLALL